jgi:ADP-ribosylation factor 2-binding protein
MATSCLPSDASAPLVEEVFASEGAPLEGMEEDGEEVFASDSKPSNTFDAVLAELEVLMMDEGLNERIDAFTRKSCGEFSDDEENKLVYTTLFTQYTAMVESYIEERLGASVASFEMASFCTTLAERAKSDEGLLNQPALEALVSYSDFDAFKALMLSARAGMSVEAEGGLMCVSGDRLGLTGVGGDAAAAQEGGDVGTLAPQLDDALQISPAAKKPS